MCSRSSPRRTGLLGAALLASILQLTACSRELDDCRSEAECVGDDRSTNQGGDGNLPGTEPTILPSCTFGEGVAVQRLRGLSSARLSTGTGLSIYSWDEATNTAVVRWTDTLAPLRWTPWTCFDLLPGVTRLSAMNLANLQPEAFAVSNLGYLFARRDTTQGWTPWLPFGLPQTQSELSDVAAVGGKVAHVYAVDRGQVVVRARVTASAYSDYGDWQSLPENGATRLTALLRANQSQQVITADESGRVHAAVKAASADRFESWRPLAHLPVDAEIVELEALDDGELLVYSLDGSGVIRSLRPEQPGALWLELPAFEALGAVVGLAVAPSSEGLRLVAVDADGNTATL